MMKPSTKIEHYENIEQYLTGSMPISDQILFEEKLNLHPQLLQEVELHRQMMHLLADGRLLEIRQELGVNQYRPKPSSHLYYAIPLLLIAILLYYFIGKTEDSYQTKTEQKSIIENSHKKNESTETIITTKTIQKNNFIQEAPQYTNKKIENETSANTPIQIKESKIEFVPINQSEQLLQKEKSIDIMNSKISNENNIHQEIGTENPIVELEEKNESKIDNEKNERTETSEYIIAPDKGEIVEIILNLNLSGKILFFDKLGQLIQTDQTEGFGVYKWNGTDKNGSILPMGRYKYMIQYTDNSIQIGYVTIIR